VFCVCNDLLYDVSCMLSVLTHRSCWLWLVAGCQRGWLPSFQIFSTSQKRHGTSTRSQLQVCFLAWNVSLFHQKLFFTLTGCWQVFLWCKLWNELEVTAVDVYQSRCKRRQKAEIETENKKCLNKRHKMSDFGGRCIYREVPPFKNDPSGSRH